MKRVLFDRVMRLLDDGRVVEWQMKLMERVYSEAEKVYQMPPYQTDNDEALMGRLRVAHSVALALHSNGIRETILAIIAPAVAAKLIAETEEDDALTQYIDEARVLAAGVTDNPSEAVLDKAIYRRAEGISYRRLCDAVRNTQNEHLMNNAYTLCCKASGEKIYRDSMPMTLYQLCAAHIALELCGPEAAVVSLLCAESCRYEGYTDDVRREMSGTVAKCVDTVFRISDAIADGGDVDAVMASVDAATAQLAANVTAVGWMCLLMNSDSLPDRERRSIAEDVRTYLFPKLERHCCEDIVRLVTDMCFERANPRSYELVAGAYRRLLFENEFELNAIVMNVRRLLGEMENRVTYNNEENKYRCKVRRRIHTPLEICAMLHGLASERGVLPETLVSKANIPLIDIMVAAEPTEERSCFLKFVRRRIHMLSDSLAHIKCIITDCIRESDELYVIELQGEMASRVRVKFMLSEGGESERDAEPIPERGKEITVLTRSGAAVQLPQGATAIDLAFVVPELRGRVAMFLDRVIINGMERPIETVLNEGDRVILYAGKEDNGDFLRPRVKIDWLNHVATATARRYITEWLVSKYES